MTNAIIVLLSLYLSWAVVMMPRGMSITMPEFWVGSLTYGAPILLLAWPLYLPVFKRLRNAPWWALPPIALLLTSIPFMVLMIVEFWRIGETRWIRPFSAYLPWNTIFGTWYAIFGLLLGAGVGLTRRRSASQ